MIVAFEKLYTMYTRTRTVFERMLLLRFPVLCQSCNLNPLSLFLENDHPDSADNRLHTVYSYT